MRVLGLLGKVCTISILLLSASGCASVLTCDRVQVAHWQDNKDGLYKVSYRCWSGELYKDQLMLQSKTKIVEEQK